MTKAERDFLRSKFKNGSDLTLNCVSAMSIFDQLDALEAQLAQPATKDTSDGYHTFRELYDHRYALFAIICRTYDGWKSKLHHDGTMFDDSFIAGVDTPQGPATYHMPLRLWDSFDCRELYRAPEWDGHTPADVIVRLALLSLPAQLTASKERIRELRRHIMYQRYADKTATDAAEQCLAADHYDKDHPK